MKKLKLFVLFALALKTISAQQAPVELVYKKIDSVVLKMNIYYPSDYAPGNAYPTIVLFFGGGWVSGNMNHLRPQAQFFASKGMIAVTPEYRIANKHGTTPFECVKDGRSAMRYLRKNAAELGIDINRLAAGGASAGGHVAAATDLIPIDDPADDLTISPRPDAIVLFNPVFNNGPENYGYDRLGERYREISPYHNIEEGASPTIVFLGTQDKLIPVKTAKAYQRKMEEVGSRCELFLYDGQGHGFFNYGKTKGGSDYFHETLAEAEKFLAEVGLLQTPNRVISARGVGQQVD